ALFTQSPPPCPIGGWERQLVVVLARRHHCHVAIARGARLARQTADDRAPCRRTNHRRLDGQRDLSGPCRLHRRDQPTRIEIGRQDATPAAATRRRARKAASPLLIALLVSVGDAVLAPGPLAPPQETRRPKRLRRNGDDGLAREGDSSRPD